MKSSKFKVYISSAWLVFTSSLVSWWLFYALNMDEQLTVAEIQKHNRMIKWEGSTLLAIILIGGGYLIWYVNRDAERNERLRLFFSNFSHDIKTSITRIRLQADVLSEELTELKANKKSMDRLMKDLGRLDLQLENSLLLTHIDGSVIFLEKINLHKLIDSIRLDFDQIKMNVHQNADFIADSRSLRSIFRNLVENSLTHGKATLIEIHVEKESEGMIRLTLTDNGQGSKMDYAQLGMTMTPYKENRSNGIGLFLAQKLIRKMAGQIRFQKSKTSGFETQMILKGELLS